VRLPVFRVLGAGREPAGRATAPGLMLTPVKPEWLAARLGAAYALTVLAALAFGDAYVGHLLPLYRLPVEWLMPEFRVDHLGLGWANGESVVALKATLAETLWVGPRYVPPGGGIASSTLRGHALQHPVILYTLLLAWPGIFSQVGLIRLLFSIPLLCCSSNCWTCRLCWRAAPKMPCWPACIPHGWPTTRWWGGWIFSTGAGGWHCRWGLRWRPWPAPA